MLTLLCVCFLLGSTAASSGQSRKSSFAGEYGVGAGTPFSYSNEQRNGPITGIRVMEHPKFLFGIQLQYGGIWGPFYGHHAGTLHEVLLRPNEDITQVSGTATPFVNELVFVTNRGRILKFGRPVGNSFNDFPLYKGTFLRNISGRYAPFLRSIGFHWGVQPKHGN